MFLPYQEAGHFYISRELVHSLLCRDGADMPRPPYTYEKLVTAPTLHL